MQGVECAPSTQNSEKWDPEDSIPKGWRLYIHNFSTPWFTINMGTGILRQVLLHVSFLLALSICAMFASLLITHKHPTLPDSTTI